MFDVDVFLIIASLPFQLQVLIPGYILQMCYGMNTAFTAGESQK